jgi:hypothetical protein
MDGFVPGPYFSIAPLSSSKHVGEYPVLTTSYRELSFQVIKEDPANSRPEVTKSREFTNVTAAVLPVRSIQFTAPIQLRSAYRDIRVWKLRPLTKQLFTD